jgi:3-phenylpropionate/trans-cinnamate dioxygenase ferredoxin reductase subunit
MAGRPAIVIVGGGVAAQRCAFALRRRGYDGRVVMVCAEPALPYDRTLLSKEVLTGEMAEPLALQPEADYARHDIEVLKGTRAVGVEVPARRLALAGGRSLDYDVLVACTGGLPRLPAALRCRGVHLLRDRRDAAALRAELAYSRHLAVVGGGFIGAEVASSAVARGVDVTLIEALEQPLAAVLGREVGARVAALHRAHGVRVLAGTPATSIRRRGARGFEVALQDGRRVRADAVVVGAGMVPATGWLEDTPVRLDRGVVTDSACRTDVPGILAAGDCARWRHPGYGALVHVEHWDTAARHGAAAAAAALGEPEPFAPLPFFWSDQHGLKLQWVGYAPTWDAVDIEEGDEPHRFTARYRLDGRLVAVLGVGQPRAVAAARRALQASMREEVKT